MHVGIRMSRQAGREAGRLPPKQSTAQARGFLHVEPILTVW